MDNHRDMGRIGAMAVGLENMNASNKTPIMFYGVDNGTGQTGSRATNIGALYIDLRILGGRHVANYRLGWHTDEGQDELPLGDAVNYELAVAMYQALLQLITNHSPTHSEIKQFLLGQEI